MRRPAAPHPTLPYPPHTHLQAHRGVQTYGRGAQLLTSAAQRLAEAIRASGGAGRQAALSMPG